jgi:hypothetical protein
MNTIERRGPQTKNPRRACAAGVLLPEATYTRLRAQGLPAFAAAETATAATAATAAATTAAAAAMFRAGTGFVDRERTAFEFLAVEGADGRLGLCVRGHFDEGEASGPARELILDDRNRRYLSMSFKKLPDVTFAGVERQITNVDIHCIHLF